MSYLGVESDDTFADKPPNNGVFFADKRFWVTTSGFFSKPALLCFVMAIGIDRILFSVDYPFVDNKRAAD